MSTIEDLANFLTISEKPDTPKRTKPSEEKDENENLITYTYSDNDYKDIEDHEIDEGKELLSLKYKKHKILTNLQIHNDFYPIPHKFSKEDKSNFNDFSAFSNRTEDLNKTNIECLPQESSWKNYIRLIDRNLILLKDLKKCNIDEFEKFRFLGKLDLQKQLKSSLSKRGPVNYVTKNLMNELKLCDEFQEKIKHMNIFVSDIVDKIEFKVLEMLILCEKSLNLFETENAKEFKSKLEEKLFEANKIFRDRHILNEVFSESMDLILAQNNYRVKEQIMEHKYMSCDNHKNFLKLDKSSDYLFSPLDKSLSNQNLSQDPNNKNNIPKNYFSVDDSIKSNYERREEQGALYKSDDNFLRYNNEKKPCYKNKLFLNLKVKNPAVYELHTTYLPKSTEIDQSELSENLDIEALLGEFIQENLNKHAKFQIPTRYSFSAEVKLLFEIQRLDQSIIKFHDNFMIEYKFKNSLFHKFFADGSIISIFPNKDVRLIIPSADVFYKFKAVGIKEFDFYEKNYSLVKYSNGTVEKLFRNGMRIIKNPYCFDFKIITFCDLEYKRNNTGQFIITKTKMISKDCD